MKKLINASVLTIPAVAAVIADEGKLQVTLDEAEGSISVQVMRCRPAGAAIGATLRHTFSGESYTALASTREAFLEAIWAALEAANVVELE